jgi:hypothetical protein
MMSRVVVEPNRVSFVYVCRVTFCQSTLAPGMVVAVAAGGAPVPPYASAFARDVVCARVHDDVERSSSVRPREQPND